MKINEIRDAIDSLNWARQYNTRGTAEENLRNDLPTALKPYIEHLEAIEIPARFGYDSGLKDAALVYAKNAIAKWRERKAAAELAQAKKKEIGPVSLDCICDVTDSFCPVHNGTGVEAHPVPEDHDMKIKRLLEAIPDLTFGDCVKHFAADENDPFVEAARRIHHSDGSCEIDSTTVRSGSGDNGDYVMAWVWVYNTDAGLPDDDE